MVVELVKPLETFLLIAVIVFGGSFGDILLSRGMKQVGEVDTLNLRALISIAKKVITNISVISGIACMAIAFFSLLTVLSWAPISLVSPATAFSYVVNTIGAKYYLNEKIDKGRLIGTALVCLGVVFLVL
ncbi:MAG: EamA family transporter [Acidobacteria bacterium]|nr:EamA family transporter [Acidobacteriota bacterium]